MFVQVFHPLGDDGRAYSVHIDLEPPRLIWCRRYPRWAINDRFVFTRFRRYGVLVRGRNIVGWSDGVVFAGLVNLHGLAIEIRIGEMAGRTPKVHQGEVELAGVLMHASAAADDLLELGHGANRAVEHNEPTGLDIDAGRQKPRRGDQHGVWGFRVDEGAEVRLPVRVGPGDAHDVAGVPVYEIGVLVDECLAHAGRMFLVDAEHDRFLEAVSAVLQILRDLPGDEHGAVIQDQRAVAVPGVVDAIVDFDAVSITLSLLGTVAFHIEIDMDFDDLIGGEKAVGDALLQRVSINGRTKVLDVRDVFSLLGGGREADLRGRRKVLKNLPPSGILGGTAAMALVDHDEIEEARRKLAEHLLVFLRPGDRLIETEIDFIGGIDSPRSLEGAGQIPRRAGCAFDGPGVRRELRHCRAERPEVVDHGLVDQHIAIGQKQDALLATGLPQPPDDLERGIGLAGAGRHDQQDAVVPLGDGLHGRVDGGDLVVPRDLAAVVEIVLEDDGFDLGRQTLPGAIACPQLAGRRESVKAEGGLPLGTRARSVVEEEPVAVRRKYEGDIQGLGVVQPLLHAVADGMSVVLGLDERDRNVWLVVENIVGALGLPARDQLAAHDDPTLGEAHFLANLQQLVPPRLAQGRRDELGADVTFTKTFLVHWAQASAGPRISIVRNTTPLLQSFACVGPL